MKRHIRLGMNIDHVATLRNARGENYPEVEEAAKIVEKSSADLITVHVREDRRHINEKDLGNILNWIEQLEEVNTNGVEPLTGVNEHPLAWRYDAVTDGEITDEVLKNAPEKAGEFFVVPKVIE